MQEIQYATTSEVKFRKVYSNLLPYGIRAMQRSLEMEEMQSDDGAAIARHKAEQAYIALQQPVLVSDDTWSIPALRGFPSTSMKLCNQYLLAEDWLRLMQGLTDRRIFLIAHYAFHNGEEVRLITSQHERYFLDSPRGHHATAPCLEVIARVGSPTSIAEDLAQPAFAERDEEEFWPRLAELVREE